MVTARIHDAREKASEDVIIILVGNKSDLESNRAVPSEEGRKLAQNYGVKYFESSSKNNNNISVVFSSLLDSMMAKEGVPMEESEQTPETDLVEEKVITLDRREKNVKEDMQQREKDFCMC